AVVERRVIAAPLAVPIIGFIPWICGVIFFPLRTLVRSGQWTPELLSQHVYSPLVNGFLAAATTYLLTDWLFRMMVVPRVFPAGCARATSPCVPISAPPTRSVSSRTA